MTYQSFDFEPSNTAGRWELSWRRSETSSCTGLTLRRGSLELYSVRWSLRRRPSFSLCACLLITWQMSLEGKHTVLTSGLCFMQISNQIFIVCQHSNADAWYWCGNSVRLSVCHAAYCWNGL